ncbi:MAG TPA: hypothetical protein VK509_15285 [Polyangiales bacterium]|nr:hypothetical protein [Polyangiales bacterium]
MRTLKWQRVGTTVLVVHARLLPDPVEWNAFIRDCSEMGGIAARGLVFAEVTLNAEQRRQIQAVHRVTGTRAVAVITSSLLTRVLVTTMNWMRNNHRAFAPNDIVAAFDFLRVNEPERHELLALALQFARELNLSQLAHTLTVQQ